MYFSNILLITTTALVGSVTAQTTTGVITGTLGNATIVENNPPGVVYTAKLPTNDSAANPSVNIQGSITGTAAPNGIGVNFQVHFSNFPTSGGPFRKSIHSLS